MRKLTRVASVLSLAVAAGCGSDSATGPDNPPEQPTIFRAVLDGSSVAPPVATSATGTARFEFQTGVNEPGEEYHLLYSLDVSGLGGTTQALLRRGAPRHNGEILYTICGPTRNPACQAGQRLQMSGIIEPTEFPGSAAEMDQVRKMVEAGDTYIEVQTTAHPAGELRGQLRP